MSLRVVPFHVPDTGDEEVFAVVETLRSGWLTRGPRTIEFEQRLARYIRCREVVGVSSCTAAT